ncbi:MAG: DUF4233 domain-containing protein [Actinobacteria bacterium]|nr:DUF4233 domain-containing protein [Actinomycetota bacterium]
MRILGAAVLAMESLVMGFALLLATKDHSSLSIAIGGCIAIAFLLCAGLLKRTFGWILGSLLQIAIFVVAPLIILGVLFSGLWVAAIIIGRKGEAARAALLKAGVPKAS